MRKNAAGEVELSENALWKVYKAGDVQFTRYGTQPTNNEYGKFGDEYRAYFQNIATKRWMRMNDKHQLALVDDEQQASAFAHIHSYTTYDYAKYHVALARLSVVVSAKEYYSIGCNKSGNGWETMSSVGGQVVRLSKWSSLREKKQLGGGLIVLLFGCGLCSLFSRFVLRVVFFVLLYSVPVFWHVYCIVLSVFYFNDDYNNTFGLFAFLFGIVLCAIHR